MKLKYYKIIKKQEKYKNDQNHGYKNNKINHKV